MEQQHIDTMRTDPEYGTDAWAIRRGYELATGFGDSHEERMKQADDIAAELMQLRAQAQPPQQPMDFPDGPGWWAGDLKHRQFVVHWTGFELKGDLLAIQWDEDSYFMRYSLADFKRDYQDCKWYRLTMPWEGA